MPRAGGLLQSQQTFHKIHIGVLHLAFHPHGTLALLGLLSKDVTFERFLEGDLAGTGHFEPLLGTRIRSNLGHLECVLLDFPTGGSHRRPLMEPFGAAKL